MKAFTVSPSWLASFTCCDHGLPSAQPGNNAPQARVRIAWLRPSTGDHRNTLHHNNFREGWVRISAGDPPGDPLASPTAAIGHPEGTFVVHAPQSALLR